jgi:hypothetical protein
MSISIEREAVHHLRKPAQLNCLIFVLAIIAMLFYQAAATADTASSPPGRGVVSTLRHGSVTEPPKTDVAPQATRCLLALGDVLLGTKLLPGISKGTVNPGAVRVADPSAKTRTWSVPDPQEPDVMLHYAEISSSRFQVLGVYSNAPPYGIKTLALRDPAVALPCGLRVGQPIGRFIKALGRPPQEGTGDEVEYYWEKFLDTVSYDNAYIVLRFGSAGVQEIRWEYGVH